MTHDTLYYDGDCPLCSVEMQKLKLQADDQLRLVDIHSLTDNAGLPEKQTLLSSLHLKRADGEWLTGLDANVAAWQHTRFGLFYRWLRWPLLRNFADWLYGRWAQVRYRRLYGDDASGRGK
jgi:predicted DCC family thiol-disulfide oxidoreductase YuxK